MNLPPVKTGNKIQIGKPLAKQPVSANKPQSILTSLCDYGSGSSDGEESEEEIEPIKQKTILQSQEKRAQTGLLSMLPAPKSNVFIAKKIISKPVANSSTDFLNLSSSKNTSTNFTDAKSLVPRTLKTKVAAMDNDYDATVITKKFRGPDSKVKLQTYVARPDPVIPNYVESYDDPEPVFKNEEEDESEQQAAVQQLRPEEFGQANFDLEAMRQLGGGRKNLDFANAQITDIKLDDVIGDNKAELMRNITSTSKGPSNRDFFGGSSKKKHQITYLAYVAKEREEELKNQWSQSAFSKKQSRERYGF